MRSTVEAGGADPDNARHSVPVMMSFPATGATREADGLVLTAGRGAGRIRRVPQAAGHRAAGRGSSARPQGFRPKGAAKAAAADGASPI